MANSNTVATNSSIVRAPVAIGLPSPATPAGQHHLFYQHLSPFSTNPSPFADSAAAASTIWSSIASPRILGLLLRALAFLLSFSSAIAIAVPRPQPAAKGASGLPEDSFNILHHSEFRYCLTATIISSAYLAFQVWKGIWDIAFKGFIVPERVSDYITFFFDQIVAYLLISSTSVSVLATQIEIGPTNKLRASAIASTVLSFGAFLAMAASALLAGYRLCKRVMW